MMFFSDIHDHPLFPFRTSHIVKEAKDKFPFNKPLGIDTNQSGVDQFLDFLISHIEEYYLSEVISNLESTIKVNSLTELAQLQFYEEASASRSSASFDNILPNEIFYSLSQIRKNIYDNTEEDKLISEDEKNSKVHNTFIHDKMLFDSFNASLGLLSKRKVETCPWDTSRQTITIKKYSDKDAVVLFNKAKSQVLEWNKFEAGTNKVPLPEASNQQTNSDDVFAPPPPIPTENERNQQIREEKLSMLLSKDINEEDKLWMEYEDCSTQVKLDLADMILEDLATEMACILMSN